MERSQVGMHEVSRCGMRVGDVCFEDICCHGREEKRWRRRRKKEEGGRERERERRGRLDVKRKESGWKVS